MEELKPHHFEYHKYLKKILGLDNSNTTFFIATEKDFANSPNLNYPYRSYFYVIGLMHEGNNKIKIGIKDYSLTNKTLSFVGPGIVRTWERNDWTASNHTIFFIPEFFSKPFQSNLLSNYAFFNPGANHAINLIDADYEKAKEFIRLLQLYTNDQKVAQGILFAFLEFINQIYTVVAAKENNYSRNQKIARDFNQLLHDHYQEQKEVAFYAATLNLSPKNLSEMLKQVMGRSAKQSIEDFIVFEAKSLLKQTQMSIKEIVYWLGYEDPSYFAKFFKRKEGITPVEYRNK
jgi:AraC family transcriptional regulator, transcriptional activator of pobA